MKKQNFPAWNQVKAARALLDWRQCDLAQKAGVSTPTVKIAEHPTREISYACLFSIRHTLENHGIQFIETGVQMKELVA